MTSRICPECHTHLGHYDSYFCSVCGNLLSDDAVKADTSMKMRVFKPEYSANENKLIGKFTAIVNPKTVRLLLRVLPVFLLGVVLYVGLPYINKLLTEHSVDISFHQLPKNLSVKEMGLDLESDFFGTDLMDEYVPETADFFVEIHDLEGVVAKHVIKDEFFPDLLPVASDLLSDHFVLFADVKDADVVWTFLFVPNDMKTVEDLVSTIENPYWHFMLVEDRLVMTTDPATFDLVMAAKNKHSRNLALNPVYVRFKDSLPKSGRVMIVFLSREGKLALDAISSDVFTQETIDILSSLEDPDLDAVVIN